MHDVLIYNVAEVSRVSRAPSFVANGHCTGYDRAGLRDYVLFGT